MKTHLASAPDSWGVWFADDRRQPPWQQYLDEVSQAGYRFTELGPYGYLQADHDILNVELQQRGLKCIASMLVGNLIDGDAFAKFRTEFVCTCKLLVAVGAQYIGIIE